MSTSSLEFLLDMPREILYDEIMSWWTIAELSRVELVSHALARIVAVYMEHIPRPRDLPRLLGLSVRDSGSTFRPRARLRQHMIEARSSVSPHLIYDHGGERGAHRVRAFYCAHPDRGDDWCGTEVWPRMGVSAQLQMASMSRTHSIPEISIPRVQWYPRCDPMIKRLIGWPPAPAPKRARSETEDEEEAGGVQHAAKRPRLLIDMTLNEDDPMILTSS
jgi:hypothetical protein